MTDVEADVARLVEEADVLEADVLADVEADVLATLKRMYLKAPGAG
ncbi:hypothetical protein [Streptococcus suis]